MLTLVTGGSGSGKSAFAEDRVLSFGDAQRIYIATMHPVTSVSIISAPHTVPHGYRQKYS